MMADSRFPAFIKLEYQSDDSAKNQFLADVNVILAGADRETKAFAARTKAVLADALTAPRTSLGSLDLGVGNLHAQAVAQQAAATAAREIANATEVQARKQGVATQSQVTAIAVAEKFAVEQERAAIAARTLAQSITATQNELNRMAISSDRASAGVTSIASAARRSAGEIEGATSRAGIATFELQHVVRATADSFAAGLPASTIFAEQIGRVGEAAAFAGAGGGLGTLGRFLGGPWGIALTAATAVLAPLVGKLFEASDAARLNAEALGKVAKADDGLSEAQGALAGMFDLATGALQRQNGMLRANAALVAAKLRADAISAGETARTDAFKAGQRSYRAVIGDNVPLYMMNRSRETNERANIEKVLAGTLSPDAAIRWAEKQNFDRLNISRDEFMNAVLRAAEAPGKRRAADEITSALDTGKLPIDLRKPATGRTPRTARSTGGSDNTDQLASLARRAADEIAAVNAQFDDQPTLVDKSAAAVRKLDDLIADLEKRKPPNYEKLVSQARAAEDAARGFASVEITKQIDQANKALAVQLLVVSGRDEEASVLAATNAALAKNGKLGEADLDRVRAQASAEFAVNKVLQERLAVQAQYLDATRSIKGELENILAGTGKLSNFQTIFKQLNAKVLAEKFFGDTFRNLDKYVKEQTGIGSSVDVIVTENNRAGAAAGQVADDFLAASAKLREAANGIGSAANDNPGVQSIAGDEIVVNAQWDSLVALRGLTDLNAIAAKNIGAAGVLGTGQGKALTPQQLFDKAGLETATRVTDFLNQEFRTKLFSKIAPELGGAFSGYSQAGVPGAILGAAKEIKGLSRTVDGTFTKFGSKLNGALEGAGVGSTVSGVAGAFGVHLNQTGSQIGGALGSLIPIPGANIIGSIIGGVIGNVLSAKTGSASIGKNQYGAAGVLGTGGNNAGLTKALSADGQAVSSSINQIADQLNATVGNFAVAIGQRNDEYRVSASGNQKNTTSKGTGSDIIYKGKDQSAAIAAALTQAIAEGAIKGISAASQKILQSGQDLQTAITKASAIENIPVALKAFTDPVGAAVDSLDRQFSKLVSYLQEGDASTQQYLDAQKLYSLQRAAAIKQASDSVTGSLRSLYDSLTVGNDALSLNDRKTAALAAYSPLQGRVAAGDTTAFSDFATAAQNLLGIDRALYGSQDGYFAQLSEITALSKSAITDQQTRIDAATASASPFASLNLPTGENVVAAVGSQTADLVAELGGRLDAVNTNLGALIQGQFGSRTSTGYALAGNSFF